MNESITHKKKLLTNNRKKGAKRREALREEGITKGSDKHKQLPGRERTQKGSDSPVSC